MQLSMKRIYEPFAVDDGFRILIDRIWPRGVRKDAAHIDLWLKEAAPSTELRQWFNHEPEKWATFKSRYFAELDVNQHHLQLLLTAIQKGRVSLIYSSRDEQLNQAVALREYIESRFD